ncbi:MAG: hypothetical protein KGO82_08400 [Bacteroidota bacterium]|nr:hypothetical protein [Bacteroidota bacterium]
MKLQKNRVRILSRLVVIIPLVLFFSKCQKSESDNSVKISEAKSGASFELMKQTILKETQKGFTFTSFNWDNMPISGNKIESSCIATAVFKGASYVAYDNGDCYTLGTYTNSMSFQLGFGSTSSGAILQNPNSLSPLITFTYADGSQSTLVPTLNYLGRLNSGLYNFTAAPFQIPNYCNLTTLKLTVTPTVTCPDGQVYTQSIDLVKNITAQQTDPCLTIAPIFVQTQGVPHQLVVAGFFNPCSNNSFTPCIAFPSSATFYYRIQGTITWSNFNIAIYNGAAYTISGLSSGTYEYYSVGYTSGCQEPASPVRTISVL